MTKNTLPSRQEIIKLFEKVKIIMSEADQDFVQSTLMFLAFGEGDVADEWEVVERLRGYEKTYNFMERFKLITLLKKLI
jgi:hypothetical protein